MLVFYRTQWATWREINVESFQRRTFGFNLSTGFVNSNICLEYFQPHPLRKGFCERFTYKEELQNTFAANLWNMWNSPDRIKDVFTGGKGKQITGFSLITLLLLLLPLTPAWVKPNKLFTLPINFLKLQVWVVFYTWPFLYSKASSSPKAGLILRREKNSIFLSCADKDYTGST